MAGTMTTEGATPEPEDQVSMESGLDGRNNMHEEHSKRFHLASVSMESGLDGRNNQRHTPRRQARRGGSQWSPA